MLSTRVWPLAATHLHVRCLCWSWGSHLLRSRVLSSRDLSKYIRGRKFVLLRYSWSTLLLCRRLWLPLSAHWCALHTFYGVFYVYRDCESSPRVTTLRAWCTVRHCWESMIAWRYLIFFFLLSFRYILLVVIHLSVAVSKCKILCNSSGCSCVIYMQSFVIVCGMFCWKLGGNQFE